MTTSTTLPTLALSTAVTGVASFSVIHDTNDGLSWRPGHDSKNDYILVTYDFKTSLENPQEAAYFLAREQSVSTYKRLHGETEAMRQRRSAKVVSFSEGRFTLAYPLLNVRTAGELLVTINGNGNFLNSNIFSRLRVENIEFPDVFLEKFQGPKYGKSLLDRFQITDRPLLIGVQKPSIGLSAEDHVERALEAFRGGCDIVKDDEQLYPDDPENMLSDRLSILAAKLPELQSQYGRRFMYVFNLANENTLFRDIRSIEDKIATDSPFGIMLSPLLGLPFIHSARTATSLPIFTHPSGSGIYTRGDFGFSSQALVGILRLCGADCIIHPGPYSNIAECAPETAAAVKIVCDQAMGSLQPSLLALGGGMNQDNFSVTKDLMGGNDFVFLVGGAIYGNLEGPRVGAQELIQHMRLHS